jgi:hypothetical protein
MNFAHAVDAAKPTDRPALRLVVRAEAYQGLGEVRGQLLFDGTELRFDFQAEDALFGLIRSGSRQICVPLSAIESVRRGLGWFWLAPYIEIALNDFALLSQVPGSHQGSWRLRVRFADRHLLKRFADAVAFARAGRLHEALNNSLDSLPPSRLQEPTSHTPVEGSNRRYERE